MGSYGSLGPNYYTDRLLALRGASGVAPRKFGKAPAALSPNAGIPQSDTTDPDLSGLSPEDQQILNAMYPPGSEPQTIPSPGLNLGPLHVPGQALDQASLAMLNQLQSGPRAANFGQGLVAGLVQSRANAAMGRSNANAQALQQAHQDELDRRKLAAQLLQSGRNDVPVPNDPQWQAMFPGQTKIPVASFNAAREYFSGGQKTGAESMVDIGPDATDPYRVAAKNAGISLPPGTLHIPQTKLIRELPMSQDSGGQTAQQVGDAIISGFQPPVFTNMRTDVPQIRAYLAGKKFNLSQAQNNWLGTQTYVRSLNGRQQVQLHNSASAVQSTLPGLLADLDQLDKLAPTTDVTSINALLRGATKNFGANGPKAQDLAQSIVTKFASIQPELANVYSAGGVPSDKAQALVDRTFNLDLPVHALKSGISTEGAMINVRTNAISESQPTTPPGFGPNQYYQRPEPPDVVLPNDPTKPPAASDVGNGVKFLNSQPKKPKVPK